MADDGVVLNMDALGFLERGNGVRSCPLVGPQIGASQLLSGVTDIPSHQEIPLHSHNSEEFILVLDGEATVRIGEHEHHVAKLDATFILPGVTHQFINSGSDVLRILWVYGDVNSTRTLASTGQTLGHLDPYPTSS